MEKDMDSTKFTMKSIAELHQELCAYGKLKLQEKVLIVAGVLLAFQKGFEVSLMKGDSLYTDGILLYDTLASILEDIELMDEKSMFMEQFVFLKTTKILNEVHPLLEKTPLKHFAEFLQERIPLDDLKEDYIGRFYSEFMSYESSEGQTLGIILTPAHVTNLFTELLEISEKDIVLDPCAGTAGFLIGGFAKQVKNSNLYGYEVQHFMYTVACLNLMIRGCKKIQIQNKDFLDQDENEVRNSIHPTIGMINPPYALGSSVNPYLYEMNFIKHLLDCMEPGGKVAAIVPTSSVFGKTKEIKQYKKEILMHHTLDGVITMNPDTFYGVDTQTVIAVFTAGIPHAKDKQSKFIDFREDGYEVSVHIGLLPTKDVAKRKKYLLDVWFDRIDSDLDFCIKTHVTAENEWLHSSFYKKEEDPTKEYFEKKVKEYLAFRCVSILQERMHLFAGQKSFEDLEVYEVPELEKKNWKFFKVDEIFDIKGTKVTDPKKLLENGIVPRVCCAGTNNGIDDLYQNAPTEEGHVLTVESATVGNVHYQQVPFISSSHVEKLSLKDRDMNVFIGLFLAAAFAFAIEGKYNYGYKLSKKRIKQQMICLPVVDAGIPDYEYMEIYIQNLISEKWSTLKRIF